MTTHSDEPKANIHQGEFVDGKVKVVVKVIKAEELKCEGKEPEKINPYVAVTLGSDNNQKFKTKPIKHNPNPEWNEKFEFTTNNLEDEVIFVDMKSKGKTKNTPIMKRVKISFVSFQYGETKQVEKELHWKDEYVGRLYLEISLKGKGRQKSDVSKSPKSKSNKDPGLCFKVLAVEAKDVEDGEYCVQLKMASDDTQSPITSTQQGTNPKWNEELYIKTRDASKDTLKVNLLKNGKRICQPPTFDTSIYSVGQTPITFDDDVYNKKKEKVGHLKLKITPLDYNTEAKESKYDLNVNLIDCDGYSKDDEPVTCDLQINGKSVATSSGSKKLKWNEKHVLPFNNLKKDVFTIKPSKGDAIAIPLKSLELGSKTEYHEEVPDTNDCTLHFTLEPVEHNKSGKVKQRSLNLGQKCDFSLGDYSSDFSTTFTSLTSSFQQSVSDLRSDEDDLHPHHDVEPDQEEKPCRYDNVKGSLKSLSDLIDVGSSSSQVYVTLDVLSMGKAKKAKTKESNKCDPSETPELSFDLQNIKKGNTLVFNIWKTVSGSDDANIGVVEIPVKEIPENKDKKMTRDIKEPKDFSYGEHDSFGTAVFQLNHTVDFRLPYSNEDED